MRAFSAVDAGLRDNVAGEDAAFSLPPCGVGDGSGVRQRQRWPLSGYGCRGMEEWSAIGPLARSQSTAGESHSDGLDWLRFDERRSKASSYSRGETAELELGRRIGGVTHGADAAARDAGGEAKKGKSDVRGSGRSRI
jgi:hypothetical protein